MMNVDASSIPHNISSSSTPAIPVVPRLPEPQIVEEGRHGNTTENVSCSPLSLTDRGDDPTTTMTTTGIKKIFRSKKHMLRLFGLIFVLTSIAVGIVFLIVPQTVATSFDDKNRPSSIILSQEERFKIFRTTLDKYSPPWVFMLPNTPQANALNWLVFQDKTLSATLDNPVDEERLVQRYALMTLFYACSGQNWKGVFATLPLRPWDTQVETHECDFVGVTCGSSSDNKGNVVTSLAAPRSRLVGRLPDELGLLSRLTDLRVGGNGLQGQLDTFLPALTNLGTFIFVSYICNMSDQMPILLTLQHTTYDNAEQLDVEENRFVSTIPAEIGRLTNLKSLLLRNNFFTGSLPSDLALLTNLEGFRVSDNTALSGRPLDYIGSWPNLIYFNVIDTLVTGTIPETIVTDVPELKVLMLNKGFHGTIPSRLTDMTNLEYLMLKSANLTGTFPPDIEKLSNLRKLIYIMPVVNGVCMDEVCDHH